MGSCRTNNNLQNVIFFIYLHKNVLTKTLITHTIVTRKFQTAFRWCVTGHSKTQTCRNPILTYFTLYKSGNLSNQVFKLPTVNYSKILFMVPIAFTVLLYTILLKLLQFIFCNNVCFLQEINLVALHEKSTLSVAKTTTLVYR